MASFSNPGSAPGTRTQVTCSKCSKSTSVPFVPTPGRPVFCRECFAGRPEMRGGPSGPRGPGAPAGRGSGPFTPPTRGVGTPRQRMMAQGRKGHFMHDARSVLTTNEGGMEDQHVRAFLEGLFARGARTSTAAAQEFLDTKVEENVITPAQRAQLGNLVERYSFWR